MTPPWILVPLGGRDCDVTTPAGRHAELVRPTTMGTVPSGQRVVKMRPERCCALELGRQGCGSGAFGAPASSCAWSERGDFRTGHIPSATANTMIKTSERNGK